MLLVVSNQLEMYVLLCCRVVWCGVVSCRHPRSMEKPDPAAELPWFVRHRHGALGAVAIPILLSSGGGGSLGSSPALGDRPRSGCWRRGRVRVQRLLAPRGPTTKVCWWVVGLLACFLAFFRWLVDLILVLFIFVHSTTNHGQCLLWIK